MSKPKSPLASFIWPGFQAPEALTRLASSARQAERAEQLALERSELAFAGLIAIAPQGARALTDFIESAGEGLRFDLPYLSWRLLKQGANEERAQNAGEPNPTPPPNPLLSLALLAPDPAASLKALLSARPEAMNLWPGARDFGNDSTRASPDRIAQAMYFFSLPLSEFAQLFDGMMWRASSAPILKELCDLGAFAPGSPMLPAQALPQDPRPDLAAPMLMIARRLAQAAQESRRVDRAQDLGEVWARALKQRALGFEGPEAQGRFLAGCLDDTLSMMTQYQRPRSFGDPPETPYPSEIALAFLRTYPDFDIALSATRLPPRSLSAPGPQSLFPEGFTFGEEALRELAAAMPACGALDLCEKRSSRGRAVGAVERDRPWVDWLIAKGVLAAGALEARHHFEHPAHAMRDWLAISEKAQATVDMGSRFERIMDALKTAVLPEAQKRELQELAERPSLELAAKLPPGPKRVQHSSLRELPLCALLHIIHAPPIAFEAAIAAGHSLASAEAFLFPPRAKDIPLAEKSLWVSRLAENPQLLALEEARLLREASASPGGPSAPRPRL